MSLRAAYRTHAARRHEVRISNDRITATAERYHFVARVPILCECSERDCTAVFPIDIEEYRRARRVYPDCVLTAPGHVADGADPALKLRDYWLQLP